MNLELMQQVRELVVAEPKRVNMQGWVSQLPRKILGYTVCGSVCCVAGHAIQLTGGAVPRVTSSEVAEIAAHLLQIPTAEAVDLFFFHSAKAGGIQGNPYHDLYLELKIHTPGTSGYAAVVAKAIDRCIARNPTPVVVPPEIVTEDQKIAAEMGITLG